MISIVSSVIVSSTFVFQQGGSWTIVHNTNDPVNRVEVSGWVSNSSIPGFGNPRFVYSICPRSEKIVSNENVELENHIGFSKIIISHMYGTSFNFEPLLGKRKIVLHYRKRSEMIVFDTTKRSDVIASEDLPPSPENISDVSVRGSSDQCVMLDTEDVGYYRVKEKPVKPGEKYLISFKYIATKKSSAMVESVFYRDDDRGWTITDRSESQIRPSRFWRQYEKCIVIPENSNSTSITFRVKGDGRMWVDNISIEPYRRNNGNRP